MDCIAHPDFVYKDMHMNNENNINDIDQNILDEIQQEKQILRNRCILMVINCVIQLIILAIWLLSDWLTKLCSFMPVLSIASLILSVAYLIDQLLNWSISP